MTGILCNYDIHFASGVGFERLVMLDNKYVVLSLFGVPVTDVNIELRALPLNAL